MFVFRANHKIQYSFMEIIPAKEAKAYGMKNGGRSRLYINNKNYDLISSRSRNDVVKIVLSDRKGLSSIYRVLILS